MRLFPDRKYRSGMRFAFWRWTDVGDYLTRLHIIQVPRIGALMLHWIKKPDPHLYLHDHPVSFFSLVLHGSYVEQTWRGLKRVFLFNIKRASEYDPHRIVEVSQSPAITLVFALPKSREWGFDTPKGWVHWKEMPELSR